MASKTAKIFKVRAKVNGEVFVFEYETYRTQYRKILSGIIIRAIRKLKRHTISKGKKYSIEIEILEIRKKGNFYENFCEK